MKIRFKGKDKGKRVTKELDGPIKIKDGLFMGNEHSANVPIRFYRKDLLFIKSNKVTHIINTVSHKVPNFFSANDFKYLSLSWDESQSRVNMRSSLDLRRFYYSR